jgi:hypothetical protein
VPQGCLQVTMQRRDGCRALPLPSNQGLALFPHLGELASRLGGEPLWLRVPGPASPSLIITMGFSSTAGAASHPQTGPTVSPSGQWPVGRAGRSGNCGVPPPCLGVGVTAPSAIIRTTSGPFDWPLSVPRVPHVMLTITSPSACHISLIPPWGLTGQCRSPLCVA